MGQNSTVKFGTVTRVAGAVPK
ncbi:hypothetical protein R3I93_008389 [Phoxinus phoxinus]|uniref:Uncharacterized protein n=1 Tax=Phoxinus phoxinus TaxID=58324 RepID=A0AAN9D949_9TELE